MPALNVQVRGQPPTMEAREPYRLTVTPSGIDVAGRLTDEATFDNLIRHLNAFKMLLRPASEIKKPDEEATAEQVASEKPKTKWI